MAGERQDIAKAADESLQPARAPIHSYKGKLVSAKQLWGSGEHGSKATFKRRPECFTRDTGSSTLPRILSPSGLTPHKLPFNMLNPILSEFLFFPAKQWQSEPLSEKRILVERNMFTQTDQTKQYLTLLSVCTKFLSPSLFRNELIYLRITEFKGTLTPGT